MKKLTPRFNPQLYAKGCSFLLNVFLRFLCMSIVYFVPYSVVTVFYSVD